MIDWCCSLVAASSLLSWTSSRSRSSGGVSSEAGPPAPRAHPESRSDQERARGPFPGPGPACAHDPCHHVPSGRPGLFEQDEEAAFAHAGQAHGDDLEVDSSGGAVAPDRDALAFGGGVLLPGLFEGALEIDVQALAGHLQQVQARRPGGRLEIGARPSPELEDLQRPVDQHPRGGVLVEDDPVGRFFKVGRRGEG